MLSNAYFLAKFRFGTAENEPAKNLQKCCQKVKKFEMLILPILPLSPALRTVLPDPLAEERHELRLAAALRGARRVLVGHAPGVLQGG